MSMRTEEYPTQSREFLYKGREALDQWDLVQASEKLWGAAAQMIKSVAERRGWQHGGHRELFRTVSRIAQDSGDGRLIDLFQFASNLQLLRELATRRC